MAVRLLVLAFVACQLFAGVPAHAQGRAGEAAVAGSRDAAAARRTVRVGLYENKPKIYTGDGGSAEGIFPDILSDIARREAWDLAYVPCQWSSCLEALAQGAIDLMPDVAVMPERDELFDFHGEAVVSSWSAVYAGRRSPMDTIADLKGRRLAVLKGSIQQTVLEQMLRGFGYPATFVEADSFEEAFRLTAAGDADAVVANHFFGDYFSERYGLRKTSIVFNPVSLYFAARAGANRDLLEAIDDGLRAMKADPGSAYYTALARWMERPARPVVAPHLVLAIGVVSGLLALALLFIALLRWQVGVKTRHLAVANERLRDSEEKFRDLFEKHAAVKLLVDPGNGVIVEANEAAARFYGCPKEQLRGMGLKDISTQPPGQVVARVEDAVGQGRVHFESRHRLAGGAVRDVEVHCSRIDVKGRPLLHAIVHDITERRRLEEQLRQAQKMEAVGRLAGGVAHDYNNMLGVILGRTEIALARMAPSDPLRGHLQEVLNAATRSADITRQLLAFSRKQSVAPRVLDLNDSVEQMLKMLRWLIGENIELAWLPAAEVWPIRIDTTQLDQVLANLCVNARDAIADMGKITIETDNASLDAAYCEAHPDTVPGDFVVLSVSDTGCGIDEETLKHVFDPFFTTKDAGAGTGLGLATVFGIVRQNGGFIQVSSTAGAGSTFRVHFPRCEGRAEAPVTDTPVEAPRGRGETVLLVEDDRSIRSLCREMLANLGYRVLEAAGPGEALRLAGEQAGGVDLLVTDVVMPEMNGRELAERLQALEPKLKTLYMSGYASSVVDGRGAAGDGVPFLQKPFTLVELAAKVRAALG